MVITPPRTGLRRLWYVYSWRLRYWWFDTAGGQLCRRASCLGAALLGMVLAVRHVLVPAAPHVVAGTPVHEAFVWWVQLIIMVIASLASYYLSRTSTDTPEVQTADIPTTEEGTSVKRIYGTRRIKSPAVLAWQSNGTTPIKSNGGKK